MTIYYKVSKSLSNEIYEVQKEQDEISHYKAKLIELGELQRQTKRDIMKKVKNNIDEIEKQNKNEESKGWINTAGYRDYALKEKYVFPALNYVFDLEGLARRVNKYIEGQVEKVWGLNGRGTSTYEDKHELDCEKITSYIRFIEEKRQHLIWFIRDSESIEDMEMYISFQMRDEMEFLVNESNVVVPNITKVHFYLSNKKGVEILWCGSSSAGSEHFKTKMEAHKHIEEKGLTSFEVCLSNWERDFNKLVSSKIHYIKHKSHKETKTEGVFDMFIGRE